MGIDDLVSKAKDALAEHGDTIDGAIDKAAEVIKDRTDHDDTVDSVVEKTKGFLDSQK
jgi:ABC-type transporter Mla subunit MlaD